MQDHIGLPVPSFLKPQLNGPDAADIDGLDRRHRCRGHFILLATRRWLTRWALLVGLSHWRVRLSQSAYSVAGTVA